MAQEHTQETQEEVDTRADALREKALAEGATEEEINTVDNRYREPNTEGGEDSPPEELVKIARDNNTTVDEVTAELDAQGINVSNTVEGDSNVNEILGVNTNLFKPATEFAPYRSDDYVSDLAELAMLVASPVDMDEEETDSYKKGVKSELFNAHDIKQAMAGYVAKYANMMTLDSKKELGQLGSKLPPTPENNAALGQAYGGITAKEAAITGGGIQKAFVDKYADATLGEFVRASIASKATVLQHSLDVQEDKGGVGKTIDVLGLIFKPLGVSLGVNDMLKDFMPNGKQVAPKEFIKMFTSFQNLDPDKQEVIGKAMVEKAYEAYNGNNIRLNMFTSWMYDPDVKKTLAIEFGFEAAEGASYVASLGFSINNPASILRKSFKAAKNSRLPDRLANLNKYKEAVEVSKRTKTAEQRAIDADPMNPETSIRADVRTEGLSGEYQKLSRQMTKDFKDLEEGVIKQPALEQVDRHAAADARLAKLNGTEYEDGVIQNARITNRGEKDFTIDYQIWSDSGIQSMRKVVNHTIDDAGLVTGKNIDFKKMTATHSLSWFQEAKNVLKAINPTLPDNITFGNQQVAKAQKGLNKIFDGITKGHSKEDIGIVDALITRGDEVLDPSTGNRVGQDFTDNELLSGTIETSLGKFAYTPKQVEIYRGMRQFYDQSLDLIDKAARDKLVFMKYKEGHWFNPKTKTDEVHLVKPYKDGKGFQAQEGDLIMAPDLLGEGNTVIRYHKADMKAALDKGYTPVMFPKPIKVGDKTVTHGFMPPNTAKHGITDIRSKVIPRRAGYAPDKRTDGLVYIKDNQGGELRTVARAANRKEAQAYIDEIHARQIEDNVGIEESVNLMQKDDRALTDIGNLEDGTEVYGGLIYGSRSSKPILDVGPSLKGRNTRIPVKDVTQQVIESIAGQLPMNEYKLATIKTWKEQVKTALDASLGGKVDRTQGIYRKVDDDNAWMDLNLDDITDKNVRKNLIEEREYFKKNFSIQSNDESMYKTFMNNIAEGVSGGKVQRAIKSAANAKPYQAFQQSVFSTTFGWLNPTQLFIQGANMTTTLAMHPIHGAASLKDMMVQKMFLNTDKVDMAILRQTAKDIVPEAELNDLVESLAQYKRSGIGDAILSQNADQGALRAGVTGGTRDSIKKVSQAGLKFFEQGNEIGLLTAWNVHRRVWKKANPGKTIDEDAIRFISSEAHRTNLAMQSTMAAKWQQNALTKVPLMFVQPMAKFTENVISGVFTNGKNSGQWTRKETMSTLAGLTAMFGTEGVPMLDQATAALKEGISGSGVKFALENPETNKIMDEGVTGAILAAIGADVNMGDRMNLMAAVDDTEVSKFIGSVWDYASGQESSLEVHTPMVTRVKRGYDVLKSLWDSAGDLMTSPTLETLGKSFLHSADAFMQQTSTWSNARKMVFYWANIDDKVINSRGDVVLDSDNLENVSMMSQVMKASGFTLTIEKDLYENRRVDYDEKQKDKDTYNDLRNAWQQYDLDGNVDLKNNSISAILSIYEDNPYKRNKILSNFFKEVTSSKSMVDKEVTRIMLGHFRTGSNNKGAHQASLLQNANKGQE